MAARKAPARKAAQATKAPARRQPRGKRAARKKAATEAKPLKVVDAIKRDLAEIAKRDKALAESGLLATALQMARELDKPRNSATSKAMCAKSLRETLDRLRELAPPKRVKDGIDDLGTKRATRRAAARVAATPDLPHT